MKELQAFFNTDNDFFTYVIVIICIYVAQTCFKISKCRKDKTFSWQELIDGTINYAIYFIGLLILFFGGTLAPDKEIINFDGKSYTITSLLTLFAYLLMVAQAYKCFRNIKETFQIEPDKPLEVNDKDAYFPTKYDEERM